MKYFSMFSGIGGFEMGFPPDWVCVGHSETNKFANMVYRRHFPHHENLGDATRIVSADIPNFDLLCGGFPCPSFSVAGNRGGLEDSRGALFFEVVRVLDDKRPRYFLLENVKGLISHDDGKTFQRMLGILADVGYFLQWEILNSCEFGVPQRRERIFFIGHLGGTPRPQVFPVGKPASPPKTAKGKAMIAQRGRGYALDALSVLSPPVQKNMGVSDNIVICAKDSRRFTPTEAERLQGFPDGYTAWGIDEDGERVQISDTQRYKMLGNAVTVNVVRAIAAALQKETLSCTKPQ